MDKSEIKSEAQLRHDIEEIVFDILVSFDTEQKEEVVEALINGFDKAEPPKSDADAKAIEKDLFSDKYYAVCNSDLLSVTDFLSGVEALLKCDAVEGLVFCVSIWYKLRKNRVIIDQKQAIVLATLKRASNAGMSLEVLNSELPIKPWIEPSEIQTILQSLQKGTFDNGRETTLVEEKDGKWRAVNV